MDASDAPVQIPLIFASSAGGAFIRAIPTASLIGIVNGAASFTDGFPPDNLLPLSSGGAGPFGEDFNGLLFQLSAGIQFQQAGGPLPFDATFSTNIGGYPEGALLPALTPGAIWLNLVDDNTVDPDTTSAGSSNNLWRLLVKTTPIYTVHSTHGTTSYTVPEGIYQVFVRVTGAGGSGANYGATYWGGGGGAGETREGYITVAPGQVLTIVTGQGGAAASAGVNGNIGTASSITGSSPTVSISANPGAGGTTVANGSGGGGGSGGSGGTVSFPGGDGADGGLVSYGDGIPGGNGGASFWGGGSRGATTSNATPRAPGSGGGGTYGGGGPSLSGAGADGLVLIKDYA